MFRLPSKRRRRGGSRALLAAGLAAAVVGALALPTVLPGLEAAARADEQEEEEQVPIPELAVAPEAPVLQADAERFRFTVLLRNPGEEPLDAGVVRLAIDAERAQADALQPEAQRESLELVELEVEATPAGEQQELAVEVERADMPGVYVRQPGVYPLRAEFLTEQQAAERDEAEAAAEQALAEIRQQAGEEGSAERAPAETSPEELPEATRGILAATPLVWGQPGAEQAVPLTLVVPFVLPSSVAVLPTRDELASAAPRLNELLDAAERHRATIAVDPRIVAGTRALGTAAPTTAVTLLERLERSSLPVFPLQFADADPAAQAALGFEDLLQPLGFDHATRLGEFEPSESEDPAAGDEDPAAAATAAASEAGAGDAEAGDPAQQGSAEPGADADASDGIAEGASEAADTDAEAEPADPDGVPSAEQLLQLAGTRPGAWPAAGQVDSATLALLKRSGLTSLVLDSGNVSGATAARVEVAGVEALIADAELGVAARAAIAGATPTEQAAGDAELAGRLALAAQNGATGLVLALDRGALADTADPLRFFDVLDGFTWAQTVPELMQPEGTASLRGGATAEERRELLRAAVSRSERIDELAPLLQRPEYLLAYQRERLLEAFATRYAEPGVDFAEADARIRQRDAELLQGVRPVTTESTQLVGTSSRVPVTLSNSLPFDALVSLRVAPTSAAISLSERVFEAEVPSVGSTSVLVPVHSRVSSGESGLILNVRDASGDLSFASELLHLELRTTVEAIMLGALGISAALLLGFGIWRSIRRKRGDMPSTGAIRLPDAGEQGIPRA